MSLRRIVWLLALCLPAARAHAAPAIVCGDPLLYHQQERNALLPLPKPLSRQQLLHDRKLMALSVAGTVLAPRPGDRMRFWTLGFSGYDGTDASIRHYRTPATLKRVTDNAYVYVEDGLLIPPGSLDTLAQAFEGKILPLEQKWFGSPARSGIDGDPRVTLLITNLHSPRSGSDPLGLDGVTIGGFFNDDDEYPADEDHLYSNERQMVTLNANLDISSPLTLEMLAHEYQHLIHWHYDRGEEVWVNEGLSMVAPIAAGVDVGPQSALGTAIMAYGLDYDNSLTQWGERGQDGLMADYGAAGLFFLYLGEKYGGWETFSKIVQRPEHGIDGVLKGLNDAGYPLRFPDLFSHWAVANLIDDPSQGDPPHSFGYSSAQEHQVRSSLEALHELLPDLIARLFQPTAQVKVFPARGSSTLRAQASQYIELTGTGTLTVSFDGGGHPFEAFLLARNVDGSYSFFPVPLDPQSRTGAAPPLTGLGTSVSTVYLIVTNVAEEGGQAADFRYEAKLD